MSIDIRSLPADPHHLTLSQMLSVRERCVSLAGDELAALRQMNELFDLMERNNPYDHEVTIREIATPEQIRTLRSLERRVKDLARQHAELADYIGPLADQSWLPDES